MSRRTPLLGGPWRRRSFALYRFIPNSSTSGISQMDPAAELKLLPWSAISQYSVGPQDMTRHLALAAVIALLLGLAPARSAAHEIPSDVRVQMFVKPEGQRLR